MAKLIHANICWMYLFRGGGAVPLHRLHMSDFSGIRSTTSPLVLNPAPRRRKLEISKRSRFYSFRLSDRLIKAN